VFDRETAAGQHESSDHNGPRHSNRAGREHQPGDHACLRGQHGDPEQAVVAAYESGLVVSRTS
jgi:hypothetical protein